MWRPSATLVALFAVGFIAIFGYARAMRTEADDVPHVGQPIVTAPAPVPRSQSAPVAHEEVVPQPEQAAPSQASPDDAVDKWITDAAGNDAKARATAIAALAKAPRVQALPALTRVLKSGEPRTDKPLALRSLSTLAIDQGDADNRIRETLREAVYHGDDDDGVRAAQSTLDEVEQAVSGNPQDRPPRG